MTKRKDLSPGTLLAPIPPAIVTVGDMNEANMLTVAWTGILATHPPKTYVSIRPSRHSHAMLKQGGEFVINLPTAQMARQVDYVGIYTGAKVDKFEKTGLTKVKSALVAPPTVAECPIAIECRVSEILPMGTHDVFIADIVSVSAREEMLDEGGRLCYDKAGLLAYAHGEYYALGEKLGRFGFSTDKEKKATRGKPQVSIPSKSERKDEEKPEQKDLHPDGYKDGRKDAKSKDLCGERDSRPFWADMPKGKSKKKSDPTKGRPHGRKEGREK